MAFELNFFLGGGFLGYGYDKLVQGSLICVKEMLLLKAGGLGGLRHLILGLGHGLDS